jgi:hypothetical protein
MRRSRSLVFTGKKGLDPAALGPCRHGAGSDPPSTHMPMCDSPLRLGSHPPCTHTRPEPTVGVKSQEKRCFIFLSACGSLRRATAACWGRSNRRWPTRHGRWRGQPGRQREKWFYISYTLLSWEGIVDLAPMATSHLQQATEEISRCRVAKNL